MDSLPNKLTPLGEPWGPEWLKVSSCPTILWVRDLGPGSSGNPVVLCEVQLSGVLVAGTGQTGSSYAGT